MFLFFIVLSFFAIEFEYKNGKNYYLANDTAEIIGLKYKSWDIYQQATASFCYKSGQKTPLNIIYGLSYKLNLVDSSQVDIADNTINLDTSNAGDYFVKLSYRHVNYSGEIYNYKIIDKPVRVSNRNEMICRGMVYEYTAPSKSYTINDFNHH